METTDEDYKKRFFANIKKLKNGCWKWQLSCNVQTGYGQFYVKRKNVSAHRFSYTMHVGEIPVELHLDHLCRNRWCVNPKHLEAVTQTVNVLRGNGIGALNARKTHCNSGHALSGHNLVIVTERRCKKCNVRRSLTHRNKFKSNLLGIRP